MAPLDIRPGNLIEAHKLSQYLSGLETRIAALEQQTGVTQGQIIVTDLLPSNTLHIGDELQIIGSNFYRTIGATRVLINSLPVTIKNTSTDTQINIDIPQGIPTGSASLEVANSTTSVTRTLTILAAQSTLIGDPELSWQSVTPTRLSSGVATPYRFRYRIVSRANRQATFTLSPVISNASWQGSIRILDQNGGVNSTRQVTLTPNQEVLFDVSVVLSPAVAAGASFMLSFDITAEGRSWQIGDHTFTEGSDTSPADSSIELGTPTVSPSTAFNDATNTITLAAGATATVIIEVGIKAATTVYTLVNSSPVANTGWTIAPTLDTQNSIQVTQQQLAAANGRFSAQILVQFTPSSSAVAGELNLGYRNETTQQVTVAHFVLHRS